MNGIVRKRNPGELLDPCRRARRHRRGQLAMNLDAGSHRAPNMPVPWYFQPPDCEVQISVVYKLRAKTGKQNERA